MTLSTGPWWCAPVFAFGWITTVPAQSFSAPARALVIAAARLMPGVCAVLTSSSFACTTRTPPCFHLGSLVIGVRDCPAISGQLDERGEIEKRVAHDQRPEPAESRVDVGLKQSIGAVEREGGDSLVQMVGRANHDARVDRGGHAEPRPQGLDNVGADEDFLENRIDERHQHDRGERRPRRSPVGPQRFERGLSHRESGLQQQVDQEVRDQSGHVDGEAGRGRRDRSAETKIGDAPAAHPENGERNRSEQRLLDDHSQQVGVAEGLLARGFPDGRAEDQRVDREQNRPAERGANDQGKLERRKPVLGSHFRSGPVSTKRMPRCSARRPFHIWLAAAGSIWIYRWNKRCGVNVYESPFLFTGGSGAGQYGCNEARARYVQRTIHPPFELGESANVEKASRTGRGYGRSACVARGRLSGEIQ